VIYDWVSYPITLIIEGIYKTERQRIDENELPCLLRLELLASFERLLCYCHTGNAAVFVTSLMNGLGLSRGALKDGFLMLLDTFEHLSIMRARESGFKVDPKRWPLKNGFPEIMSKKAQVLTYSDTHFLVRVIYAALSPEDRNASYWQLSSPSANQHKLMLPYITHVKPRDASRGLMRRL
jgi:hypothetical protein